jgi:hypothetical protein
VGRLTNNGHASRRKTILDEIGDRLSQTLLNLRTSGDFLNDPRQLAQSNDFATGQVGNVGSARERQQVMLTHAAKRDVANQNDFVIVFVEDFRQVTTGI